MRNVMLGYLHPNHLSASFQRSLQELVMRDQATSQRLTQWAAIRCDGPGIPEGRNTMARQLLETDDEWLFIVDADMGFRPDTLDRLLEVADPATRPIVGALAFAYREVGMDGYNGFLRIPQPTVFDYIQHPDGEYRFTGRNHYPVNQLMRVSGTGAACLVVHRSVLEKIRAEFGDTWFDRTPGADGLMGEDISFCLRVGALDIPIHVHTGIRTTHHKELWVGEPQFWETMLPPPATEPTMVIVPTVKGRLKNLPRLLTSLRATTAVAHPLLVVDDAEHRKEACEVLDDAGYLTTPGYDRMLNSDAFTLVEPGSFGHKINTAAARIGTDYKWVKIVGDDVIFRPQWLDHLQHVAALYGAKVVGSNDLATQRVVTGDHATHWMVDTGYLAEQGASWDGPGTLAHEGYRHWFVDDEIVAVARQRGVFQMALGSIVEHLHPIAGKGEVDEVYRRNDQFAKQDQKLFLRRVGEYAQPG